MIRLCLLSYVLLFCCVMPLYGMYHPEHVPGEPENWGILGEDAVDLLTGGYFVPAIEAIGITTIATLSQAMMYHLPFKEALAYALAAGTMTGYVGVGAAFSMWCLGFIIGIDRRNYPQRPYFQWKKPDNILSAVGLACSMLAVGRYGLCNADTI